MSNPEFAESLASFLIDTTAKGTVLLFLAAAATLLLRRSSAAMRHAVWSLTMLSLVVLPFASATLPAWRIPILPVIESKAQPSTIADLTGPVLATVERKPQRDTLGKSTQRRPEPVQPRLDHRAPPRQSRDSQATPTLMPSAKTVELILPDQPRTTARSQAESKARAVTIAALIWVAGLGISGAFLALCVGRAVALRRSSDVVGDGVWFKLLAELSQRLRLKRSVGLREHPMPIVPLTWGVFRPVVLLPKSARDWAEPMKRSVLLHELAHVRRGDVACQLLGRIACSLFWFHPLAWHGLRRLRQEGEQACDDAVVRSGEKASDYAEQLLQVAHLCCAPLGLSLGVAMAEGNSLERRVKSLFDTRQNHGPVGKRNVLTLLAACLLIVAAVATVRPVSATNAVLEGVSEVRTTENESVGSGESEPVIGADEVKLAKEIPQSDRRVRRQLACPKEWKTGGLDRIIHLDPVFGPEHQGLKLGVAYSKPQIIWQIGQRIPLELFVVNVGNKEASFSIKSAPRISYAPRVKNSKGEVVRGVNNMIVFQPPYGVTLKPGEVCHLPTSGLGLSTGENFADLKSLEVGDYTMSYRVESFTSGVLKFKVEKDDSGKTRVRTSPINWAGVTSPERVSILRPAFGEARRGIEMGLAFPFTQKKFLMDEHIPMSLLFRNVGDKEQTFDFYADFHWSPPTVVDAQGERIRIMPQPIWMYEGAHKVRLKPGETYSLPTRGLWLTREKRSLSLIEPAEGIYRIGFSRVIANQWNGPREWSETLITGSLKIEVLNGADGSRYAIALPKRAAPIEVLQQERLSAEARSKARESISPPKTDDTPKPSSPDTPSDPPPSEPEPDAKIEAEESPSLPTKEPVAKSSLDSVIWWKTVDGLQAGFLLTSPGFPNQRIPDNSLATYRVLIRNTTDKETRFVARLIPHEHRDAPFLIPSDNITEALGAPKLPVEFRAEGGASSKHADPAYVITLMPGEAVIMPGQSGLHDLGIFVGEADSEGFPKIAKIKPGMNWVVQPLQIQTFPIPAAARRTSLLGRYELTKVDSSGNVRTEPATRMAAFAGGKTLYPRIQLDVGTLTAAAVRNAKNAVWGKIDKGLQCGIRLINPQPSYLNGDTLEAELLWRSTSDTAIWTPIPRKLDLYPIVQNSEGQSLPIDFGARFNLYPISLEMRPQEVRSLGVFRIALVEAETPSPRSNAEPAHLILEPGMYKLSALGGVSAPDGGNPKSGEIPFKVIRR